MIENELFAAEINRTLENVTQGISVRVVGALGSGRSTLAKKVVAELENSGVSVYSIFATASLKTAPYAGVLSLGIDLRSRSTGILGIADIISEHLSVVGPQVVVIDDIENLDKESLAVLDIALRRTGRPVVMTAADATFAENSTDVALDPWPEIRLTLRALSYGQIDRIISQMLGAPAAVDVVARVAAKSGGNLRLVNRIIESAVLSNKLVLKDGYWKLRGNSLLNDHLLGTIEALLQGLSSEEITALNAVAVSASRPLEVLLTSVTEEVLATLKRKGFLSVETGPDHELRASVFPPLVADYFQSDALRARNSLRVPAHESFDLGRGRLHAGASKRHPLTDALNQLSRERRGNTASKARYFHEQLDGIEHLRFGEWDADKCLENAVKALRLYWGSAPNPSRVEAILTETDTTEGSPGELLFFTMTSALWSAMAKEDVAGGLAILAGLAKEHPPLANEARALEVLLQATFGGERVNYDRAMAELAGQTSPQSLALVVRALLEVYRNDSGAALEALDAADVTTRPAQLSFIRGLAYYCAGKNDEALTFALEHREAALVAFDQFGLVAHSYTAVLAMTKQGLLDEAQYVMEMVFSVRKPGFVVEPLFNAMLRISAFLPGPNRMVRANQADAASAKPMGPLPGTGQELPGLILREPSSAEEFDRQTSNIMEKEISHGYVMTALYKGMFSLCLLPGPHVRRVLERALAAQGNLNHQQLLLVADAVVEENVDQLEERLSLYQKDSDCYLIAVLLRGAIHRSQAHHSVLLASDLIRITNAFLQKNKPSGQYIEIDFAAPAPDLTDREIEVCLLIGTISNQEIASRLNISVRTVENHVHNALRKTRTANRSELSDLVHYLRSHLPRPQ